MALLQYCTVPLRTDYGLILVYGFPHVMRIIAFVFFLFVTIVSSLHCCPRSSAAARIPSTIAAPTLLATALLGATVPYIFLCTSDKI